jgi:uncharacterized protein
VNAAEPKLAVRTERPPSPCINVCTLDGQGRCVGCLRTGAEIGRWVAMSADEQWRLLEELELRRNLQGR